MKKPVDRNRPAALGRPEPSLRGVAGVLFRKKLLILLTLVTAVAAAGVFARLTPEEYESRMKILVRNARAEAPLTAGQESVADRNEVSQTQINSEMELIESRDLLERVVRELNLAEPAEPGAPVKGADIERAVRELEKELRVSDVKKANIIEVTYAAETPRRAAEVLELLSELYLAKHLKLHRPPGTYEFFSEQAERYERDLRASENLLSDFQRRENLVEIDRQKELTLAKFIETRAKLRDLEGSIGDAEKRIAALEKQLAATPERIKTQNRVLPNQFSAERLNTMLVELRNRRVQLLAKFRSDDRLVKEVDEQIRLTTEALERATRSNAREESYDVNPLRQQFEAELARVKIEQAGRLALRRNLREQAAGYESKLTRLERVTPVHDKLSRDVEKNEESYRLYAKKQEESRINDALDEQKISNVSIAEEPTVPELPDRRGKLLAVVLGLGVGLLVCIGGVIGSELMRDTFLTPTELEEYAGYPVLATIPQQTVEERREMIRRQGLADKIDGFYLVDEGGGQPAGCVENEEEDAEG